MEKEIPNVEGVLFRFPAHVLPVRAQDAALIELAKTRKAIDETVFDSSPPYVWQSEMSNDQMDDYYTRMDITSLNNYAEDSNQGIAFQDSHDHWRCPLGQSLRGRVETAEGRTRVVTDFYTIPGINMNGGSFLRTDDFILAVRSGIVTDNSIGFYFKNTDPNVFAGFRCDICGQNMMSWDCPNIPGLTYDITAEDGGIIDRVIATAKIMNAQMMYILPIFSVFIAWRLPAGLPLYWIVTTIFAILQQYYVQRRHPYEVTNK